MHSCFTFAANSDFLQNDIRVKPDLDALGALGEIGWYCIRSMLWAADFELPKTVSALRGPVLNEAGGTLHFHDFVIPFEEEKASFTVGTETLFKELLMGWIPKPCEHTVITDLPQEACMVMEFARLVAGIKGNRHKPEEKWPTFSRKTQLIMDAVKASINKGFEPVEVVS
ncbi:hypothetical protein Vadar_005802 [Vaccinium darrowii]|uniref:Uncharacterized protein n=1 Tax=Vaccinium darrowii TaxID=229202 RepID=A0ACB7WYB7_9ERIC|nr:hypothetical protein Vadar_005802 [Vaccinium darrowii]